MELDSIINDYNKLYDEAEIIKQKKHELAKQYFALKHPYMVTENIIVSQVHNDCPFICSVITSVEVISRNGYYTGEPTNIESEFFLQVYRKKISEIGISNTEWDFFGIEKDDSYIFKFICNIDEYPELAKRYGISDKITKANITTLYKKLNFKLKNENDFSLKFITSPIRIKSREWAVAYGELPQDEELYNSSGNIRKKFIEEVKYFKTENNAIKYKNRITEKHWKDFEIKNIEKLNEI